MLAFPISGDVVYLKNKYKQYKKAKKESAKRTPKVGENDINLSASILTVQHKELKPPNGGLSSFIFCSRISELKQQCSFLIAKGNTRIFF